MTATRISFGAPYARVACTHTASSNYCGRAAEVRSLCMSLATGWSRWPSEVLEPTLTRRAAPWGRWAQRVAPCGGSRLLDECLIAARRADNWVPPRKTQAPWPPDWMLRRRYLSRRSPRSVSRRDFFYSAG